jgi:hypothetical protein
MLNINMEQYIPQRHKAVFFAGFEEKKITAHPAEHNTGNGNKNIFNNNVNGIPAIPGSGSTAAIY